MREKNKLESAERGVGDGRYGLWCPGCDWVSLGLLITKEGQTRKCVVKLQQLERGALKKGREVVMRKHGRGGCCFFVRYNVRFADQLP